MIKITTGLTFARQTTQNQIQVNSYQQLTQPKVKQSVISLHQQRSYYTSNTCQRKRALMRWTILLIKQIKFNSGLSVYSFFFFRCYTVVQFSSHRSFMFPGDF